ncbi:MAG: DedA family protein [Alphaproteobacteria bacterium]|nr:MAG: DedA family protein [Alphaproteobacteria bacterium]
MIEAVLELVPVYGAPVVGLITFLSCLALPVPASIVMLAAGALSAAGDLPVGLISASALAGAISGDQLGFLAGRLAGRELVRRLGRRPASRHAIRDANAFMTRYGGHGVFLSRWLLSPLGPYVNVAAGAMDIGWTRFTFWGVLGECVWVAVYVGSGALFADHISAVADILGNATGALAAAAVAGVLGLHLLRGRAQ